MTGIYYIRNKINDKMYIGQSTNIDARWSHHKTDLRNNNHHNHHLQYAWNKYGEDNFEFNVIQECNIDELDSKEMYYIKKYKTFTDGYNLDQGGAGIRGYKHTEESKKKMSENSKGKFCGEDSPHWGKPKSEETKKKISEARKGKGLSKGENNPMYGKTHSREARKKISDANKGRCGENSPVAKKVKCLNTGQVFVSATQAAEYFGFKRYESVARVCRGERKSVKHPKTKQPLLFIYIS